VTLLKLNIIRKGSSLNNNIFFYSLTEKKRDVLMLLRIIWKENDYFFF